MSLSPKSRRTFLKDASAAALIFSIHPASLIKGNLGSSDDSTLIHEINLRTAAPLSSLRTFYATKFGLRILVDSKERISFQAGKSILTFECSANEKSKPWYHFAFNIPENKIMDAKEWLANRCRIIPTPLSARDANYPIEVRHFPHWNAHSLFFWDPAGNLVEFIARHEMSNAERGPFESADILNISEIAFVLDDRSAKADLLGEAFNLSEYPKGTNFHWAMGDANGLLLCIPFRVWAKHTMDEKQFEVFPTKAMINRGQKPAFQFEDYPYLISTINK